MSFNAEQQSIIESEETNIIINAGPGTGKTHTLIGAVNYYMQNNPDAKVAMITFTNNAADEMRKRLSVKPQFVGTIHSFAYYELMYLAEKENFRVRILQESQIAQIVKHLVREATSKRRYNEAFLEKNCYLYILNPNEFSKQNDVLSIYRDVERLYEEYKRKSDLYDFRDTPRYLLNKLKYYNQLLPYDKIYVDEVQDIDEEQFELILHCKGEKFAIGDPKQSIYMFRGASKEVFDKFEINGFSLYNLKYNYRSKQEIIDFARTGLIAERGRGGKVLYDESIFRYNPMILCRTNKEVEEIQKYYPYACTIHASKGLQFHSVLVPKFAFINGEEDENVWFVACTRAEDNLGVMSFDDIMKYLRKGRIHDEL